MEREEVSYTERMNEKHSPMTVPVRLQFLAAVAARLLVIAIFIAVLMYIVGSLKDIVVPFLIALLLTALLFPFVRTIVERRVPRGLAVAISLILVFLIVSGLMMLVAQQVHSQYGELKNHIEGSFKALRTTLSGQPFYLDGNQLNTYWHDLLNYGKSHSSTLLSGLSTVGIGAGHFITGIFLAFFSAIFLLLDGKNIWKWIVHLFPVASRPSINLAGERGWQTLMSFVRSQVIVAAVDAVGIGLGAYILGLPLAIPIGVLVFLASFIPVVGAVITGLIAVVIGLVFNGWVVALIMLGIVLLVQFLESHVLQPFLIGKAVRVHPLAVVLSVAVGTMIAGIPGALFAVPFVAVMNTMISTMIHSSVK